MTIGYRMEEKPDKSDIEIQRNSEFKPQWYVQYNIWFFFHSVTNRHVRHIFKVNFWVVGQL
jgi:regulatory protein YycH of two-component signal transduction system YycFG